MSINLPLHKLSQWQNTVFCTALIERMLPNYKIFSEQSDFGNFQLLRNQINLVWQRLDKSQKVSINYDAQLLKLEEIVPDPHNFDFYGVYPALDAAMAVMSLLQAMQDSESNMFDNIPRLSINSVNCYVELCLDEALSDVTPLETLQQLIDEHPLMQWEKETQNELFEFIKGAPENIKTIKTVKRMVLEQGLSNLGIEVE